MRVLRVQESIYPFHPDYLVDEQGHPVDSQVILEERRIFIGALYDARTALDIAHCELKEAADKIHTILKRVGLP